MRGPMATTSAASDPPVDGASTTGTASGFCALAAPASSIDASGEDITLFTPLWAHIPEASRAEAIVRGTLLDGGRFLRAFGIRALA